MTKFEKELINTANHLSNSKIRVVAVYTECWKGLSINTVASFEEYLKKLTNENSKRLNCFNDEKNQVSLVANYDLRFPIRIENTKALDAVYNYVQDLESLMAWNNVMILL